MRETTNRCVRTAQCSCGQLQLSTHGEPVRVSICHCLACQHRTGSIYGVQARFATDDVHISGQFRVYQRQAESGNTIRFRFCATCGSTLTIVIDIDPALTGIPVGAFADPQFPAPKISVYECSAHRWFEPPADAERWD